MTETRSPIIQGRFSRLRSTAQDACTLATALLRNSFTLTMRHARRDPFWAVLVIGLLSLGMGAGLASLRITDALFWEPLPFPDSGRLVSIHGWQEEQQRYTTFSFPHYSELQSFLGSSAELAIYIGVPAVFLFENPESFRGELVSVNYFNVLQVQPQLGNWPATTSRFNREIVVSDFLWRERFDANPEIIGQNIRVNQQDFRVVAVTPAEFRGVDSRLQPQFWIPSAQSSDVFQTDIINREDVNPFQLIGRLGGSSTPASVEAALAPLYDRLQESLPEPSHSRLRVFPGRFARFWPGDRERMGRMAGVLLAMTLGMLVAAALNAGNLMRVHLARRRMELALRRALGASRGRVAFQLILEQSLLVAGSCLLALPIGWALIELISAYRLPAPLASGLGNSSRFAPMLAGTSILALLLAVVNPLQQLLRSSGTADLTGNRRTGSSTPQRAGIVNIAIQACVGALLAFGAGFFFLSLDNALNLPLGFRHHGIQVGTLGYRMVGVPQDQTTLANQQLKAILEGRPGIEQVEFSGQLPFNQVRRVREVRIGSRNQLLRRFQENFVSSGFLDLLEIPLLRGRSFDARDRAGAPWVAVIDAKAARTFWPAGDALGARLKLAGDADWRTVVGIVGEIRQSSLWQENEPVLYLPLEQYPLTEVTFFVQTSSPSVPLAEIISSAARELTPVPPVYSLRSLTSHVERGFSQVHFLAWLGGASAGLILLLVLAGVYASTRQVTSHRRFEAGVRMALGATPQHIIHFFSRPALGGSLIGVLLGTGLGLLLQPLLSGLLFEVNHLPLLFWLGISSLVMAACWMAARFPAAMASRLDIVSSLKEEAR